MTRFLTTRLTWWRKTEDPGKTTNLGWATSTLPLAYVDSNPGRSNDKRVLTLCYPGLMVSPFIQIISWHGSYVILDQYSLFQTEVSCSRALTRNQPQTGVPSPIEAASTIVSVLYSFWWAINCIYATPIPLLLKYFLMSNFLYFMPILIKVVFKTLGSLY